MRTTGTSPCHPGCSFDLDCPEHHHFFGDLLRRGQPASIVGLPQVLGPGGSLRRVRAAAEPQKPVRSHWDMLRERRSVADFEEILAERLALLRAGTIGPDVHKWITPRKGKAA